MTGTADASDTPTPKQSPGGLGERIKGMSVGGLIGSAVAILIVGLVIGLAAGYKIEQTRVKNDVKNVKKAAAAKRSTTTTTIRGSASAQPGGATPLIIGTVDTAAPDSVTIAVGGTTRKVATTGSTVVVKASPGTASDITVGSRVVVKAKPGSLSDASEVVVLPANAKIGNTVASVTPTSVTITSDGKNLVLNTQGATVEKVTNGQVGDITSGQKVVAQTERTNQSTLTATEIVLLPSTSTFVTG